MIIIDVIDFDDVGSINKALENIAIVNAN